MTEENNTVPKVYAAIAAVQGEIAKVGISKGRKNQQQGYSFRGIDDVYGALASLLSKNGLCILPRAVSRECVERQTAKGSAIFYVTVDVAFDFVSVEDGSRHVVKTYGEAMDSADKATNKAMSAAYKYACLQAFCIPTEGDNDSESTTHDVVGKISGGPSPLATTKDQLRDQAANEYAADLCAQIDTCTTMEKLVAWRKENASKVNALAPVHKAKVSNYWAEIEKLIKENDVPV